MATLPSSGGGLPEVEDWHVVGDPGEPAFATGKENEDGSGADVPAWSSAPSVAGNGVGYMRDAPVAFYKDQLGIVHLRGAAVFLAAAHPSGSRQQTQMFMLPEGYRPAAPAIFAVVAVQDTPEVGFPGYPYPILITPEGVVGEAIPILSDQESGWIGGGEQGYALNLDGISFRAA